MNSAENVLGHSETTKQPWITKEVLDFCHWTSLKIEKLKNLEAALLTGRLTAKGKGTKTTKETWI